MCLKSKSFKIFCVITFLTVCLPLFSSFHFGESNSLPTYCGEYSGFGEMTGLGYNEPGACLDADLWFESSLGLYSVYRDINDVVIKMADADATYQSLISMQQSIQNAMYDFVEPSNFMLEQIFGSEISIIIGWLLEALPPQYSSLLILLDLIDLVEDATRFIASFNENWSEFQLVSLLTHAWGGNCNYGNYSFNCEILGMLAMIYPPGSHQADLENRTCQTCDLATLLNLETFLLGDIFYQWPSDELTEEEYQVKLDKLIDNLEQQEHLLKLLLGIEEITFGMNWCNCNAVSIEDVWSEVSSEIMHWSISQEAEDAALGISENYLNILRSVASYHLVSAQAKLARLRAGSFYNTRISNSATDDKNPAIWGNKIVWEGDQAGNWDIYYCDFAGNRQVYQVTQNAAHQTDAKIYGNKIVWKDLRNGNPDVYMFDLGKDCVFGTADDGGEKQITNLLSGEVSPDIYQEKIIWTDLSDGIHLLDLISGKQILIPDSRGALTPVIYGDWITWQDGNNQGDLWIYNYKTYEKQKAPAAGTMHQRANPDLFDNQTLFEQWADQSDGDLWSCDYDLIWLSNPGITHPALQKNPAIYQNSWVWDDNRNLTGDSCDAGFDVYLGKMLDVSFDQSYDPVNGMESDLTIRLSADEKYQQKPDIWRNVVVWQDARNSDWDIYATALYPFYSRSAVKPASPTSLTALPLTNDHIVLAWQNNADNERGFELERQITGSGNVAIDTIGAGVTTICDSALQAGVNYSYRIRAFNEEGNSQWSETTSATTSPFKLAQDNLTGLTLGSAAWGDYDNDGDLDILLTGQDAEQKPLTKIYQNDNGVFKDINANLIDVRYSSAACGDYDNDGDLDIALSGRSSVLLTSKIYNNDSGQFSEIASGLLGITWAELAWCDYDNDGRLDLFLSGSAGKAATTKIYRNEILGFMDMGNMEIHAMAGGPVAWGDYDNDRDMDLLLTGTDSSGTATTKVYRNDDTTFTDILAGLTGVERGCADWGDYDNDGHLDILFAGQTETDSAVCQIYRNTGNGFVNINAAMTGLYFCSVSWCDYDNDGDLDVLTTGSYDYRLPDGSMNIGNPISKIYRNDSGVFNDMGYRWLPEVNISSAAWGDYNKNGTSDLLLAGSTWGPPVSLVFQNLDFNNSWLDIKLLGITSNAAAIGARVYVKATINGKESWLMREITGRNGFVCHFGLGNASYVDSVKIVWPSGIEHHLAAFLVNQVLSFNEEMTGIFSSYINQNEPKILMLYQNYPNPFNPSTKIKFTLPKPETVKIEVYNIIGQKIETLLNKHMPSGYHEVEFNVQNLSSGIYFYRIEAGEFQDVKKMVLLR